MTILSGIGLGLLIFNGLRVTFGIPPVSYWFRSRRCPLCDGVGHLRAHSHTGEIVDVPVSDILAARREPSA